MRNIQITDITMRQSSRGADFRLSFREKIELSKLLDRLCVSAIETTPISQNRTDSLLIKSIASAVKQSALAVPVGLDPDNISLAVKALEEAVHPRLVVEAPVSPVQMEYLAKKKPAAMLDAVREMITAAKEVCGDVEFVAEDATRADRDFLVKILALALEAGATTITVCDAAGTMLPDEFEVFMQGLVQDVPGLGDIALGVRCNNALNLADACAVSAIRGGATEIKAAAYNLGTVSLDHIASLLAARGESLGCACQVRVTQLHRTIEQITRLCRAGGTSASSRDSEGDKDGTYLTAHDDMNAVMTVVASLGYELSDEDRTQVYDAFARVVARKEKVSARELDAIVASAAMQVPATYLLESYVINTGNTINGSAHMKLSKNGEILEGISLGDGPIAAAFRTIDEIIGHHYELDDFQVQAVTQGREAMGEAVVKLRAGGKLYSGQGVSADIIGASIHAYLNALNKIVYEEGLA